MAINIFQKNPAWLAAQPYSWQSNLATSERPLQEAKKLFEPGGGYGAGQIALIEEEAQRTKAEALTNFIKTGMSSGSNVAGLRARVGKDVTTAKLGVEDVRMENLANILAQLSGLRSSSAQAGMQNEIQQEAIGAQRLSSLSQLHASRLQTESQERIAKLASTMERPGTQKYDFEIPRLHL